MDQSGGSPASKLHRVTGGTDPGFGTCARALPMTATKTASSDDKRIRVIGFREVPKRLRKWVPNPLHEGVMDRPFLG